jgi:hypothetical protein
MSFDPSASEVERPSIPSRIVCVRDVSWHTKVLCRVLHVPILWEKKKSTLTEITPNHPIH